jgi:hypothetical protein
VALSAGNTTSGAIPFKIIGKPFRASKTARRALRNGFPLDSVASRDSAGASRDSAEVGVTVA